MNSEKKAAKQNTGPNTRLIHHESCFTQETGSVMPPIFATSTFSHGNKEGFDYTRSGNPNFRILESILSSIEESNYATVFGSGISAITAITSSLKAGDLILCEENLYGCTVRLFEQVFNKFGLKVKFIDFANIETLHSIKDIKPSIIWIESPTNPLLKIIDIERICKTSNLLNIPVVVDNTFCTPFIQMPLKLGATISLTSTTKYINGHSDALGGCVCTNDYKWHQKMVFAQKSLGLQPSPFDSWLTTRGIKTLGIRIEKQVSNASVIAEMLGDHPAVKWIRYPFKQNHPNIEIAKKQMKSGGAIITAKLKANQIETYKVCKNLRYFKMAESLGGVESLVCHPATMTHASIEANILAKIGIDESLVRFSIGCEDPKDLIEDLMQSLEKLM